MLCIAQKLALPILHRNVSLKMLRFVKCLAQVSSLLESLLIQEHQTALNVDGSSIALLLFNT